MIYFTSCSKITTVSNTYFLLHLLRKQAMWIKKSPHRYSGITDYFMGWSELMLNLFNSLPEKVEPSAKERC
ncbi:uncharacterized protein J3R85_003644 [Psidium guajava]|nr:uncharacterized protein J3R85_003644 [Psidium guajava]